MTPGKTECALTILISRAIQYVAQPLVPGGVPLIEPWFTPDMWYPGNVGARCIDASHLNIARMNTSGVVGRLFTMDTHYPVGTPEGIHHV